MAAAAVAFNDLQARNGAAAAITRRTTTTWGSTCRPTNAVELMTTVACTSPAAPSAMASTTRATARSALAPATNGDKSTLFALTAAVCQRQLDAMFTELKNAIKQISTFRFWSCLKNANSDTSRTVGDLYFNKMATPCFRFGIERKCMRRAWWGRLVTRSNNKFGKNCTKFQ